MPHAKRQLGTCWSCITSELHITVTRSRSFQCRILGLQSSYRYRVCTHPQLTPGQLFSCTDFVVKDLCNPQHHFALFWQRRRCSLDVAYWGSHCCRRYCGICRTWHGNAPSTRFNPQSFYFTPRDFRAVVARRITSSSCTGAPSFL